MNTNILTTNDNCKIRYLHIAPEKNNSCNKQIILLPGRSSFLEQYKEPIAELRQRGFRIWGLDWRGQGGSSRFIRHPQKNHIHSFDYFIADLHQLIHSQVKSFNEPILFLGISLGSHIGLRYLLQYPEDIAAGVLLAPMFQVKLSLLQQYIYPKLFRTMCAFGLGKLYVPGYGNIKFVDPKDSWYDYNRYKLYVKNIDKYFPYAAGGPTIKWASAMLQSFSELQQELQSIILEMPLFIALAEHDNVIDNNHTKKMFHNSQNVYFEKYLLAHHNILLETDKVLTKLWQDFDSFIERIFKP